MPSLGDQFWGHSTSRTRTLTCRCTGSLVNSWEDRLGTIDPGGGGDPGYIRASKCAHDGLAPGNGSTPATFTIRTSGSRGCGYYVECHDGFGGGAAYDGVADYIVPLHSSGGNDGTFEWTWTLTSVRTYFTLYFLTDGVAGANGDPNWLGPAVGDVNPRAIGIYWYEVADAGAVATATLYAGGPNAGHTVSCTTTLTAAHAISSYDAGAKMTVTPSSNLGSRSASVSGTLSGDWAHIGPPLTLTYDDGQVVGTVTGGTATATATANRFDGDSLNATCATSVEGEPDRRYRVLGHLYAGDADYPGTQTLSVLGVPTGQASTVDLSPSGTLDFAQRTYYASVTDNGGTERVLGSASEWDKVKAGLVGLEARAEDKNDWVTMWSGKTYPVLSVKHAATKPQPTPTGSVGGPYSISYPPFPTTGNYEGYAFLQVTCQTDAADETVTVTVTADPSKTYTFKTTGTGSATYAIDLCAPDSPTPNENPELVDTRYSIENDGLPLRDPASWGIGRVYSVSVSGGTNLRVTAVVLARLDPSAKLTALPAFLDWQLVQTDESYHANGGVGSVPIVQASRCVVFDVDGRRAIIEPCSLRQLETDSSGAPLWVYSGRSAKDLETTLNACPGFTCDHSPYVPLDGWHARDGSEGANYINGGPIFYAGWSGFQKTGSVGWSGLSPYSDLARPIADGGTTLEYQPRYHEVIVFPAAGDVWGDSGGDYEQPTPLRTVKVLRALVDGIVYDADGEPVSGATVTLLDKDGLHPTTATTDSRGRFRMHAPPGAPGQRDATVTLADGTAGYFVGVWDDTQDLGEADGDDERNQDRWNARRFHRLVFRGATVLRVASWLAQSRRGQIHLAHASGTNLKYRKAKSATTHHGLYVDATPLTGPIVSAKPVIDESRRIVNLAVTRKNGSSRDFWWHESKSDGMDFDGGALVASDAFGNYGWHEDSGARGRTWFAYASGTSGPGVQKGQRTKAAPGAPFGSTFTFQKRATDGTLSDIQVADGGWCNVAEAREGRRQLTWNPTIQGESAPSEWISLDGGATWARVS